MLSLFGPDATFGNAGQVAAGGSNLIAPLSNGQILVVTRKGIPPDPGDTDPDNDFNSVASRINADGTLDTTFGNNGKLIVGEDSDDVEWNGSRLYVLSEFGGSLGSQVKAAFYRRGRPAGQSPTFGNNGVEDLPVQVPKSGFTADTVTWLPFVTDPRRRRADP